MWAFQKICQLKITDIMATFWFIYNQFICYIFMLCLNCWQQKNPTNLVIPQVYWVRYKKQVNYLSECIKTSNIHTGDQQVNVMSSFIRHNRFEVHHVAHDWVLTSNTHATMYLTCFTSYL